MRTISLTLSLLVCLSALSLAATAEENYTLDGRAPLPAGRVYARDGEHIRVVHTQPSHRYFVSIELFRGDEAALVLPCMLQGGEIGQFASTGPGALSMDGVPLDYRIELRETSTPAPAESFAAHELAFGGLTLQVHAPDATGIRVRARRFTTAPPALSPAAPDSLSAVPTVAQWHPTVIEELGWLSAALPKLAE